MASIILAGRFGSARELNPFAPAPENNPKEVAGLDNTFCNQWTTGPDGEKAICDLWAGLTAPEVIVYDPATGKAEHTGAHGRYSFWITNSNHRYFVFTRQSEAFLYDRAAKREKPLFSITPNQFYNLATSPDGHKLVFTQKIRDSNLWLAHLGNRQ